MSKKQKFQEILAKFKFWSESNGDATLEKHIKELENEINASFDAADDDEEGGENGGNHPPYHPGKP